MDNGTSIVIDLAGRYAAAFGIVKASELMNAAVISKEENKYEVNFFDDFNTLTEDIRLIYSVEKNPGRVITEELRFFSMLSGDSSSVFAPPLMMDFRQEKNLIETETNGDDNIIVERWGTKPGEISMRGILIDVENRQYPSDQIRKLYRMFKHNNAIKVIGTLFEEKDISNIYFKEVSITPMEGFSDTVQFNFTASSIKDVSWTLTNPNT
ncbi:MAG: DUF6046 domain-containing protein [Chryseobacterium sp.]